MCRMEDGPEIAEGAYKYWGKTYRLQGRDSEVWCIYDGDTYLGDVIAVTGVADRGGATYRSRRNGDDPAPGAPTTDNWRSALEYLIDQSSPVGG
jgi:hypothetical protein